MADEEKDAAAQASEPEVEPLPEYELDSYEPVEFTIQRTPITDEQVEYALKDFAERNAARYEDTGRKIVGPKENVRMKVWVGKDGKAIDNLCTDDRPYTLGENLMPIEFDRAILGMSVGETRKFKFKAPDFDDPEFKERDFDAEVTMLAITTRVVHELTDEYIKEYLPMYDSLDDLRKMLRTQLSVQQAQMKEQERLGRAVELLSDRFHGSIDDKYYEEARDNLIAQYTQQANAQGMDLEDWIGKQGMDKQQFSMGLMMQIRQILVSGFCLDAWARHYGIEPTEDDIRDIALQAAPQGQADKMLEEAKKDPRQYASLKLAARRMAAGKDLVSKSHITIEGDDPMGSAKPEEAPAEEAPSEE